jgi:hypothetical protein
VSAAAMPALKKIEKLEKEVKKVLPAGYVYEFDKVKQANLEFFDNGDSVDSFIKRKKFNHFFFKKLSRTDFEAGFDDKSERIDRVIDLVFFFSVFLKYEKFSLEEKNSLRDKISSLKYELIKSIWWYGERGGLEDLDLLNEKKTKADEEIRIVCEQSQLKIIDRHLKKLQEFFDLDAKQLLRIIEEMIVNRRTETFAPLPDYFVPPSHSKAILQLTETKDRLERLFPAKAAVKEWLATPKSDLLEKTPIEAIKEGKVFRVLQLILPFEEGPY